MSLLSAVLQEADKANTEDFSKHRNVVFPKIKELTEKSQALSWSLQENLIDTYITYSPTKSLEQLNYRTRKSNLFEDHEKLKTEVESLEKTYDVDDEFKKAFIKMITTFGLLENLCIAVEAKRDLEMANHEFARYQYCAAMMRVTELRKQLKTLKLEDKTSAALSNIIAQAENQYSIYSSNLSVEWEDIFSWSEKKGVYHLTYSLSVQQSDPVVIQNVLKTLYATNRLNLELGLFSNFFIQKILHNIIRHNCIIFGKDEIAPNHTFVCNIKIDLEDKSKPTFQTVFINLMGVFDFLQSTLGTQLDAEKTFIAVFADSIRGRFFNKIIEDCIRNNLPSCNSSYQNYSNLVVELDSFNKFLVDLKFVAADESPLNKFVNNTELVLYNKKCDKLLSDVRSLLNESLSYGTITVGVTVCSNNESVLDVTDKEVWDLTKPLLLPKCVVSQNVKKIMMTIVEHLVESIKLPMNYTTQLIAYIKSIAVMYQSVVPKKFKVNLECCPLDIALFFNNCFYLAHGLLGPPWQNILPAAVAEHLTTVAAECIQDLRVLGLEKISLYLQNQKAIIIKNIQPDELTPWNQDTFDQFDGAINDALTLMKDLKHNWLHILPSRMYNLSVCMLIQVLCQTVLQRVFANSQAVDEDIIYMIAVRLEDIKQEVLELFEEPIEFEKKIDIWSKFVKMPLVLKAQLLELSRLWNQNKDLSQSYSCEEVRQIIKMRFPDDKYRLKILMEIQ
ncbi:centromere/kinetochore protein zw10 [Plutella xylostella]|uniref:centromere/kinetochore protein zw10 n=1 Tax=Plutella xylostella TaxID=51655 RepID=UPI0020328EE1|nr:centromere/kinetochore protein zw10 [Plutella xylostella]